MRVIADFTNPAKVEFHCKALYVKGVTCYIDKGLKARGQKARFKKQSAKTQDI